MLTLRGISKRFGTTRALADVDLEIPAGSRFVLIGGSGAGKTTLLRVLAGLEPPDSGAISCDGVDITDAPPHTRGIAMLSQDYAVYPHLTIEKNLLAAIEPLKLKLADRRERIESALGWFGLMPLRERRPAQLSGGQLQRAALAKALIRRPKVLLLDEPLSQLDVPLKEQGRGLIHSLTEQFDTTLVMVTHDPMDALRMSDRLAVMEAGAIVQVDVPETVYRSPASRNVAEMLSPFGINSVDLRTCCVGKPPRTQALQQIYFRPEAGRLVEPSSKGDAADDVVLVGTLERLQFLGLAMLAFVLLEREGSLEGERQWVKVMVRAGDGNYAVGQAVGVQVSAGDVLRLESEQRAF